MSGPGSPGVLSLYAVLLPATVGNPDTCHVAAHVLLLHESQLAQAPFSALGTRRHCSCKDLILAVFILDIIMASAPCSPSCQ
jgi:hypothetical protein